MAMYTDSAIMGFKGTMFMESMSSNHFMQESSFDNISVASVVTTGSNHSITASTYAPDKPVGFKLWTSAPLIKQRNLEISDSVSMHPSFLVDGFLCMVFICATVPCGGGGRCHPLK